MVSATRPGTLAGSASASDASAIAGLPARIDSRTVEDQQRSRLPSGRRTTARNRTFFKVRVRGMFPSSSARQFISETDVSAHGRVLRPEQYQYAPKILTVDPAWEGDDEFVIGLRQGPCTGA